MAIRVYGYRPTTPPPGRHANPAGWAHHSVVGQDFNEPLPVAGRIISLGSWTGSLHAFAWQKKFAAYLTTTASAAGNYPYLGETAAVSAPANYTTVAGGADINAVVNSDTVIATRKSRSGDILVYVGDRLAIAGLDLSSTGIKTTAVGRSYPSPGGVVAGSRFLGSQETTNNFDAVFAPTNPNGLWPASDKFALYALIEENRAPVVTFESLANPSDTIPTGGAATFPHPQPEFEITFTDADRLATPSYFDYPKEILLSIYRWTGVTWVSVSTTSYQAGIHYDIPADAQDEPVITLTAPSGLLVGETYRVHAQARDELDVWSTPYSNTAASWGAQIEFNIAEGGYVEDLTPIGRTTDTTPDFTATYRNNNPYDSATVQVRVLTRSGSGLWVVSQESDPIVKVVPPDSTITVTWADTGFTALAASTDYAIEWRVVDDNDQQGSWIGRTGLHTNYRPNTPTGLAPANNTQSTSAPLLTFNGTDNDDTPASSGGNLTAQVEITGPYLVNSTFDTDATGWSAGETHAGTTANLGRVTDQVRTGAGSYKIDVTANTAAPGYADSMSVLHPIVEGYTYLATVYRRLESANVLGQIALYWYDASSSLLSVSVGASPSSVTGAWAQASVSATAPAGATQMRIALRAAPQANGNTGDVWFDDVAISSGVRALATATKTSVGDQWSYQTDIGDDVAAAGQYSWRAILSDGDLSSQFSSSASFTMVVGPEVDVTYPVSLDSLTTHRPLIEWTVTGDQNRYRVIIRDSTTNAIRHDTGFVSNTATRSYLVPSGVLNNLDDVNVQVVVESPALLLGYSTAVRFTVDYPAPDAPTDLSVYYEYLPGDEFPSAIRLTWTPVDTASDALVGMEVWRFEDGDETTLRLIATFAGFDPGTYLDKTPKSGVNYRYYVRQEVLQAGTERYGNYAEIDATITLYAALLEVVGSEETDRVVMTYWGSKGKTLTQQQNFVYPAGGGDYVEHLGLGTGRDFSLTWQVVGSERIGSASGQTAREQIENFERIFDSQAIYSYRDGWGNQEYVRIMGNPSISYRNSGPADAEVTMQLRRIAYTAAEIVDAN